MGMLKFNNPVLGPSLGQFILYLSRLSTVLGRPFKKYAC